ncbi:hypothetical protein ACSSS7_005270 [Eimeria intestinalis]
MDTGNQPATRVLAWAAKCPFDVRSLHLSSLVICPPPPLQLPPQQAQPALAHRFAHGTTPAAEDAVFSHLRETSASEGLRLLVSDLRRQEAARHRMRRRGGSEEGEARMSSISGLLPISKPSGITSTDICRVVRHLLRNMKISVPQYLNENSRAGLHAATSGNKFQQRRLRVGHGGTLDPAASGTHIMEV